MPSTRRKILESAVVFILAILLVGMMYLFLRPWLDTRGQQWVRCEVTDVQGRPGLSIATSWHIQFSTNNCGQVNYSSGIDQDNYELIGDQLEPGLYEFRMGHASRTYAFGETPEILSPFLGAKATAFRPLD